MKFSEIPQFTKSGEWECSYSIDSFVKTIEQFEQEDGLQMDPYFQRGHVWTEDQQIKYIEFLLRGGKTGRVIYLNKPDWMRLTDCKGYTSFVCVDGLQRTTAIKRFVKNEIPAFGIYYKDFEGSPRVLHEVRINVNDLKTPKEVLQWYLEMNEGGTPHSKEELQKVRDMLELTDAELPSSTIGIHHELGIREP